MKQIAHTKTPIIKITPKNKGNIQFCFSNPHIIKSRQEINGLTEQEIVNLGNALKSGYGDNWFSMFLALKPKTLNKVTGAE